MERCILTAKSQHTIGYAFLYYCVLRLMYIQLLNLSIKRSVIVVLLNWNCSYLMVLLIQDAVIALYVVEKEQLLLQFLFLTLNL